jgi:hypothetical protein
MGRLAVLLSFLRTTKNSAKVSDVKVNPGGGANVTAEHFSAAGDDSHPIPGDFVALNGDSGTGREVAIGYLDPTNAPKALTGDKRIYARGSNGMLIVEVWLKNTGEATSVNANGSVTLQPDGGTLITTPASTFDAKADGSIKGANGNGSFELAVNGDFLVNGVTIDTSGNISTAGTLNADDITADNQDVTLSTHETPSFGAPPTPGT